MAYIIPTYFTAVNQISPVMNQIGVGMSKLGAKAAAAQARMNALTPNFGGIGESISKMIPHLAAGGVLLAAAASGKAILDYGEEIANLSAVTGATGEQLDIFKTKITEVAKATQRSTTEVAKAFTTVDNNMPELHKLPEDLAEVTKQTIILAKASRMDLAASAEAMTMSMHQFNITAKESAHVVDVMAAGAVYGSSRIAETAEALQKFGAAAKNVLNVTYEESVGLIELASRFEKGSEAGTRLRNILLDMGTLKAKPELAGDLQQLGVNIDLVTDKTRPLIDRLTELSKIKGDAIMMQKLFDKRNITMASGIFQRIDKFAGIMDGLKAQGLGAQMAETNTNNLKGSVDKLVASWVTMITTSGETNVIVGALSGTIKVLANNLDWLAPAVLLTAQAFYGWKAAMWLTTKSVVAFDYVIGLLAYKAMPALNTGFAMSASSINGFAMASKLAGMSMWGILGVVGAVVGVFAVLHSRLTDNYSASEAMRQSLDKTKDGFTQVRKKITDAEIALQAYNTAMKNYNEMDDFRRHGMWEAKNRTTFDLLSYNIAHPYLSAKAAFQGVDFANGKGNPLPQKKDFRDLKEKYNENGTEIDKKDKPTPPATEDKSEALLMQIRDGIYNMNGGRRGAAMPSRSTSGSYT